MIRNEYAPTDVSPPGDTLAETLELIGMTQAELAQRTGRPLKTINEIIQGKAAITPDTALQLERVLGAPASFWQNRESHYREYLARRREEEALQKNVSRLKEIPVAAMVKQGYVLRHKDRVEQLREVLSFFGCASVEALEQRSDTRFRASIAFKTNPIAVGAWLRKGHLEAQKVDCAAYDEKAFMEVLLKAKKLAAEMPDDFDGRLQRLCAAAGVAVVFVPELPATRAWGATRWISPTKAVIQLSLRYKREDHLWFTFFHEAAHVLKHGKKEIFIESADAKDAKELEANHFAAEFLIPTSRLQKAFEGRRATYAAIRKFAASVGVSPGIVVGRLQHEKMISPSHFNGEIRKLDWKTRGGERS